MHTMQTWIQCRKSELKAPGKPVASKLFPLSTLVPFGSNSFSWSSVQEALFEMKIHLPKNITREDRIKGVFNKSIDFGV